MSAFLSICLLAAAAIAATSTIAYEIMGLVWARLPHMRIPSRVRILAMIVPVFCIHIINIWLYALIYFLLENNTDMGRLTGNIAGALPTWGSFVERLYFSASTYASLGLGDITPAGNLRMITSAEVLNGLVTIGWTISFTYLVMEKFWMPHKRTG